MKKTPNFKPVLYRVEDKYALSEVEFERLKSKFLSVLPVDSGEPYCISSLYFDDYKDTFLEDTINGQPIREKYRVRIYNDSFKTIKLEHKMKKYSRIHKVSTRLDQSQIERLVAGKTLTSNDALSNLFNSAILTKCLRPKVIVTYKRTAFVYDKGNVRITFDEDLKASNDAFNFGNPQTPYDYPKTPFRVVEVKYDEFLPDFIANLLEHDNMWQSSNSKYRICREIYL